MTPVSLRLAWPLDGDQTPAVVYAVLVGPDGSASRTLLLPAGGTAWHTHLLQPGAYTLSIGLPSGQEVVEEIQVGKEPIRVEVCAPAAAHEHLSWAHLLGAFGDDLSDDALDARRRCADLPTLARGSRVAEAARRGELAYGLYGIRGYGERADFVPIESGRSVRLTCGGLEPVDYRVQLGADEENVLVRFEPVAAADDAPALVGRPVLMIRGVPGVDPWLVSLPLPWMSTIGRNDRAGRLDVLVHQPLRGGDVDRPRLAVVLRDPMLGPLLGYLRRCRFTAVQTIGRRFLRSAAALVITGRRNPFAEAIAGYVGLVTADAPLLRSWLFELARSFAWLPDAGVLAGWCRLHGIAAGGLQGAPDVNEARRLFLAVERQGPPVLTGVLGVLVDGLKRCLIAAEARGDEDDEVRSALMRVRGVARVCDDQQPFTVLRSATPLCGVGEESPWRTG